MKSLFFPLVVQFTQELRKFKRKFSFKLVWKKVFPTHNMTTFKISTRVFSCLNDLMNNEKCLDGSLTGEFIIN